MTDFLKNALVGLTGEIFVSEVEIKGGRERPVSVHSLA